MLGFFSLWGVSYVRLCHLCVSTRWCRQSDASSSEVACPSRPCRHRDRCNEALGLCQLCVSTRWFIQVEESPSATEVMTLLYLCMLMRFMLAIETHMKSARAGENRDKCESTRTWLTIEKGERRIAWNGKDCRFRSKFESKRRIVIENQDENCSIWKF